MPRIKRKERLEGIQIEAAPASIQPTIPVATSRHGLDVEAAVQAIAFIIHNNLKSCWFSQTDRVQTMKEGFSVVTTVLERLERLRMTIENKELKVNGEEFEIRSVHVEVMTQHLSGVGPCNFSMEKGLTTEEFLAFMELLSKPPHELAAEGDFTEFVLRQNYPHITSRRVILREVAEDEAVISKEELEKASEEERKKVESDVLSLLSAETREADAEKAREKSGSLCRVVTDSEKMASLIMQAAEQKQSGPAGADREQVTKLVVECLDKAFEALLDDPFSKTQKGKKTIAAALQRLEKDLLSKMQVQAEAAAENPVTSAVERMTERLKMDSVVQDYTRKLKALEESEKKILRFIKVQGLDRVKDTDLQAKLGAEGVDVSGWHRLLAMSGARSSAAADESEQVEAAVSQLANILERLQAEVKNPEAKADAEVVEDLRKVSAQVQAITDHTQQKISGLVESVQADVEAVERVEQEALKAGLQIKMSRKQMVTVLAEVVQEVCQPLSVISCTISMLSSKSLGELSQMQMDMLNLVMESVTRIQMLVNSLERIAGQPKTLSPDAGIQKALYTT